MPSLFKQFCQRRPQGNQFWQTVKKTAKRSAVFFREGISFLWGIAKNYIMYWGVTSSIIA